MAKKKTNIGVIGAGSWGGTLAYIASQNKHNVTVWTPSKEEYKTLKRSRKLLRPVKVSLPKNIGFSMDLEEVVKSNSVLIIAVPTKFFKDVVKRIKACNIPSSTIILSATKGITEKDCSRPSRIMKEILPKNKSAILSGPNIAKDVLSDTPIITVIASKNVSTNKKLQEVISSNTFRVYTNTDVDGVEIAGALKNVIAVGAGISDGLGFNISTKSALISRGLVEIARISAKEGGKLKTLYSAAGIGDLIATCCSSDSRNYRVGNALGEGKKLKAILKELGEVAEGVETVKAMKKLSRKHKTKAPITNAIYEIIVNNKNPKAELKKLLNRPLPGNELDI